MEKILVVLPLEERHKQMLEAKAKGADFLYRKPAELTEQMMEDVTMIIGNIPPRLVACAKNLKWMQLQSAGTDGYLEPGILRDETILTNATGAYGLAIAEHMVGAALSLYKRFPGYYEEQKKHHWTDLGPVRSIYGSTCLVVGLGDIGQEFAKRMKALGSYIIGIRRTPGDKPECADEVYTLDQLSACLKRADIVAAALPGTPQTYHLFDKECFMQMKDQAIFINVGRGNAVETDSLVEALNSGKLAGAAVDVTEPEPLPAEHALWDAKNIIITPHVSGGNHLQETFERIVRIAIDNLEALMEDKPLRSVVDRTSGYAKRA